MDDVDDDDMVKGAHIGHSIIPHGFRVCIFLCLNQMGQLEEWFSIQISLIAVAYLAVNVVVAILPFLSFSSVVTFQQVFANTYYRQTYRMQKAYLI